MEHNSFHPTSPSKYAIIKIYTGIHQHLFFSSEELGVTNVLLAVECRVHNMSADLDISFEEDLGKLLVFVSFKGSVSAPHKFSC